MLREIGVAIAGPNIATPHTSESRAGSPIESFIIRSAVQWPATERRSWFWTFDNVLAGLTTFAVREQRGRNGIALALF